MTDETNKTVSGLEDVIALETRTSMVDGAAGELVIAGYPVEKLAEEHSFEAVWHLLFHQRAPDTSELEALREDLARRRRAAFERLRGPRACQLDDPMDALRAALAGWSATDDLEHDALEVLAAVPVANAFWLHAQHGRRPSAPQLTQGHTESYLQMITREPVAEPAARALEKYLSTVSDHGLNASTFTARVIASTNSDLISAVVGAVGALKGPLHGGAPGPVLDMLDAIEESGDAVGWIRGELDAGRRIMGMGHRVYRVRDPRAAVFEGALDDLAAAGLASRRLELAREVESVAERVLAERYPDRELKANVEFYTAVLLEAVGVPRQLFTPTFAVGRMAGWTAHVREQREEGRLIRPRSRYVGARMARDG
ncbi:MAG: citrate synthase [Myxococcota bacterium]